VTSVTIAIPVTDLVVATAWYDAVFETQPSLEPAPDIVEYEIAGTWVQLMGGCSGVSGWVLRYGVDDLDGERERLKRLGISFGAVRTIPGVISFFDFADLDGNGLSCYHVLAG
jgi:hypothetical protein